MRRITIGWLGAALMVVLAACPVYADIPEVITALHTVGSTETVVVGHDVEIRAGGRLVIEPGAKVIFVEQVEPNPRIFGIYVQAGGELIIGAPGAAEVVIQAEKFAQLNPPVRYTGWQGIKNLGGLVEIRSARIQMANWAVWSAEGDTVIADSTIEYCHSYGVWADTGKLKITGSTFHDNGDAVYLKDFRPYTAQICGNNFTANNHSIRLAGENYVTIRANDFTDGNAGTIMLEKESVNGHVSIAANNFYHHRDRYDPESETFFYIIQNEGTPLGIFDCYWSNLGTPYVTVAAVLGAHLAGPVDMSGKVPTVIITSPRSQPADTATDGVSPELVELSPLKVRPGTVALTVVMVDTGWGIDPQTVQIAIGGQPAKVGSYIYNNRQYVFLAEVALAEGTYTWSVQAVDIAGNLLTDPRGLQQQTLTVSASVTSVTTPVSWQNREVGVYHLITVPVTPYQQDHLAVLGLVSPGSTVVYWQNGSYQYYGDPSLTQFGPGRGFWLKLGEGDRLIPRAINGQLQSGHLKVSLAEGWHLIGNPFETALDLKKRMTFFYGTPEKEHSWQQAVVDGYISNGLWGYQHPGYYSERTRLEPWQGYWLRVKKACQIQFRESDFSYSVQNLIDWEVQLTASQNQQTDSANYFGTARMSQVGVDVLDVEKPPAFQSLLRSYFVPEGVQSGLGADFRRLNNGREVWEYRVTGLVPGEARIQWGSLAEIPENYQLTLEDLLTGETIDLRRSSGYQFVARGESERVFEITVSDVSSSAVHISNVRLNKNPFSPLRQNLIVNFDLDSDAVLEIRIYDWVGNLVYTAPSQRVMAGIDQEFRWDGRNNLGRVVANGIYFCKITAKNGKHQSVHTLKIAVVH